MPTKRTKTPKENKKYRLEFSLASAFFWSLGLFLLLAWIFVLGIFVGRGFFPGGVKALTEMKTQIARLQDMLKRNDSAEIEKLIKQNKDPEFQFYDELTSKKKVTQKKRPAGIKKTEQPESRETRPQPVEPGRMYTVQVASLESGLEAVKMVNRFIDRGYQATFHRIDIKGKTYYRVYCGRFRDRKEADDLRTLLAEREKTNGFVTEAVKGDEPVRKPLPASQDGIFTVQVSSVKSETDAERIAGRLTKRGYPAFIVKADVKGETYYRVRCGSFRGRKEAGEYMTLLAQREGINGFVTRIE